MIHTENDHKAIAFVDPKLFENEADLYDSKWWDYRFLHPVEATTEFANAYIKAVKNYLKKQIDLYIGLNAKVLKKEDFFLESKTTITGMWKARQLADSYGIPYEFWCFRAMDYADECCWPYYPKPSHLYSEKVKETAGSLEGVSIVEFIVTRWREWSMVNTNIASSDFYHPEQNQLHPYHIAHQLDLVRQIKRRAAPEHALSIYLYEHPTLSIHHAREHFTYRELRRAKNLSG